MITRNIIMLLLAINAPTSPRSRTESPPETPTYIVGPKRPNRKCNKIPLPSLIKSEMCTHPMVFLPSCHSIPNHPIPSPHAKLTYHLIISPPPNPQKSVPA
ncbi:hypothetical protein B0T24DRAFT_637295 [Lasiosphaeria ovina]|uniref:Secreted protein n=1 Tax=Lasiosphaeria ovina TaxID=92902 RepID=A0AAE0JWW3_9PEZI|nr:hypothetical protein B0T24DRAFT_637295 [Lasiosphaeria ovina]